ncbi:MAG: hypothetical protein ACLQVD_22165 [Capsulimonadaceae bacterium]
MIELDRHCARCKAANIGPGRAARAETAAAGERASHAVGRQGEIVPPAPLPPAPRPDSHAPGRPAIYTQSAWQRPDGRWLSSREIAEVEQLARKYVTAQRSNGGGGLNKLMALVGLNKSPSDLVTIQDRVNQIGIPYEIFQSYATARRER